MCEFDEMREEEISFIRFFFENLTTLEHDLEAFCSYVEQVFNQPKAALPRTIMELGAIAQSVETVIPIARAYAERMKCQLLPIAENPFSNQLKLLLHSKVEALLAGLHLHCMRYLPAENATEETTQFEQLVKTFLLAQKTLLCLLQEADDNIEQQTDSDIETNLNDFFHRYKTTHYAIIQQLEEDKTSAGQHLHEFDQQSSNNALLVLWISNADHVPDFIHHLRKKGYKMTSLDAIAHYKMSHDCLLNKLQKESALPEKKNQKIEPCDSTLVINPCQDYEWVKSRTLSAFQEFNLQRTNRVAYLMIAMRDSDILVRSVSTTQFLHLLNEWGLITCHPSGVSRLMQDLPDHGRTEFWLWKDNILYKAQYETCASISAYFGK